MEATARNHRTRFGPFEVDSRSGELYKHGIRLKLQDQPFQVLALLLEHPCDVVTREELRQKLWPADTFVDFDNGLNSAIKKLRDVLSDSADEPRYIETLPRRGYRFIAPVLGEDGTATSPNLGAGAAAPQRHRNVVVAVVVVMLAGGITGGIARHARNRQLLTEKDTIVLGDFANSTGDSVFDGTLREGLSVQLQQSPFLSLISEDGIEQTLQMMGQPANVRLTPQIAREVCQRTNSLVALDGSIALIGTRYDVILKAVNCANGDLLASTEAQANDKSHVLDALSKTASEMRTKLGESLSTVQKYNTPLEQATTPSLDALQAYSLGVKAENGGDIAAAVTFFGRATQIDQNFAMAYLNLAGDYEVLGESALGVENSQRAFALRDKVSALEKLMIEEGSAFSIAGDLAKGRQICEFGIRTYPRSSIFQEDLAASWNFVGQYELGLQEALKALRIAPYRGVIYRGVAHTQLYLNRPEEAEAIAKQAHAKGVEANLRDVFYLIAFYRQDNAEMTRQATHTREVVGEEDLMLALQGDTAAYFGKLREAREFSRRAADFAEQGGVSEIAATYRAVSAIREALFGNAFVAKRTAEPKEHLFARDLDYAEALAFAYAGDVRHAQALADALSKRFPEDTVIQFNYLPTVRAKLALLRSDPQEALRSLEAAVPYEFGLPATGIFNWPNLYPVYVRGEAYLGAHRGKEAAAEFQKILDHRGLVANEPIGALAHLQLGRAYTLQGDSAKAQAAYKDFLTLWKDADPDVPILQQAKAEYAKLN